MENKMQLFSFEGAQIRSVVIDGEPWFVGRDVCQVLGYVNETKAMSDHCRGVTKRYPIVDRLGRRQEVRILSEPDVMRLICGSKLPAAERFERWVFEEVLPAIRRTGRYAPQEDALADDPGMVMARGLIAADKLIKQKNAQIAELEAQIDRDHDKVVFAERLLASETPLSLGTAAKLLRRATGVEIGSLRLFHYLLDTGYLCRVRDRGVPTQRAIELGVLEAEPATYLTVNDGVAVTCTPRMTVKGLQYFIGKLARQRALGF